MPQHHLLHPCCWSAFPNDFYQECHPRVFGNKNETLPWTEGHELSWYKWQEDRQVLKNKRKGEKREVYVHAHALLHINVNVYIYYTSNILQKLISNSWRKHKGNEYHDQYLVILISNWMRKRKQPITDRFWSRSKHSQHVFYGFIKSKNPRATTLLKIYIIYSTFIFEVHTLWNPYNVHVDDTKTEASAMRSNH